MIACDSVYIYQEHLRCEILFKWYTSFSSIVLCRLETYAFHIIQAALVLLHKGILLLCTFVLMQFCKIISAIFDLLLCIMLCKGSPLVPIN